MNRIKTLALALAFVLGSTASSWAGLPWLTGTHSVNVETSATPSCSNFSTSDVCYIFATAAVTATTLQGGSIGKNYLVVVQQDGTGGWVWTPPATISNPDGSAIAANNTTAGNFTVYLLQKTASGNVYQVQGVYDNVVNTDPTTLFALGSLTVSTTKAHCNWSLSSRCSMTAAGALTVTMDAPYAGGSYKLQVTQDATGRAITLSPLPIAASGVTVGTDLVSNAASSVSVVDFYYDGTSFNVVSAPNPVEICAGQATLSSGSPSTATVSSKCFTGATNVVLCTDNTTGAAGAALRCTPAAGSLAIIGPNSVTDSIGWARVQ